MSDLEQDRPLTRRERRMREMVETGAVPTIQAAEQQLREAAAAPDAGDDIEISPVDEQGRERSRREIRMLREQALAQRAEREAPAPEPAAQPASDASAPAAEGGAPADAAETSEPESSADPAREDVAQPTTETLESAPVAGERSEAEPSAAAVQGAAAPAADQEESDDSVVRPTPENAREFGVGDEMRLPDFGDATARPAEAEGEASPADADEAGVFEAEAPATELPEAEQPEPELPETQPFSIEDLREVADQRESGIAADAPPAVAANEASDETGLEGGATGEEAGAPDDESSKPGGYSFPDIAPLDDHVSVFDDPAQRTAGGAAPEQGRPAGDFDDLISRAVAQESATTTTNGSALILPVLPDTGDLSGPLGGTGELFVTGSISLPKSVGETGGHMPLADAGDADRLEDLGYDAVPATSNPILPVSAKRAVSAMNGSDAVVKQETKEKSKLPVVLIATGGGLVLAVGALVIWGAVSGMFG